MAKKSRRERKKVRKKRRPPPPFPRGAPAPRPVAPVPQEAALPGRPTVTDFREQYSYVYQDLKRVALLAGAMFAALIILSFVLK